MHWRWLTLGLVILVLDVAAIILHVGIIVVIVLEVVVLAQLAEASGGPIGVTSPRRGPEYQQSKRQ